MSLTPMLGDFELPKVTRLETMEARDFVELPVPGRPGSLFQDLNRKPARIVVEGSIFGAQGGLDFLASAREKYAAGEPLTFTSDIVNGTELQYVLMQQLHVQAEASAPDQIDYVVWLTECPPPPPPAGLLEGIDGGLLDAAAGVLDDAMGALDALAALGNVPELSDPTTPLAGIVDGAGSAIGAVAGLGGSLRDLLG